MTQRALVLLAQGAEEMETAIVVDVLRRANVEVILAGIDGLAAVTCSRGLRILPDAALDSVSGEFAAIILPGGAEGAERLADSPQVGERLRQQWERGGIVAAICAAPIALRAHRVAVGQALTSHASVQDGLASAYTVKTDRVVQSGKLITSQGPGTSFEFALALVRALCGPDVATRVAQPMVLPTS